jgi:6-pyruvoyltetrahydropterin/6-carboxytetrahydropterin synthase
MESLSDHVFHKFRVVMRLDYQGTFIATLEVAVSRSRQGIFSQVYESRRFEVRSFRKVHPKRDHVALIVRDEWNIIRNHDALLRKFVACGFHGARASASSDDANADASLYRFASRRECFHFQAIHFHRGFASRVLACEEEICLGPHLGILGVIVFFEQRGGNAAAEILEAAGFTVDDFTVDDVRQRLQIAAHVRALLRFRKVDEQVEGGRNVMGHLAGSMHFDWFLDTLDANASQAERPGGIEVLHVWCRGGHETVEWERRYERDDGDPLIMMELRIDGWRKGIRFSSAHITPEHKKCGRLHGHTYAVHLRMRGKQDDFGIVLDFGIIDEVLRAITDDIDHLVLVPTKSNHYSDLDVTDDEVTFRVIDPYTGDPKTFHFPRQDCAMLDIPSTTAEDLCKWVYHEFMARTKFTTDTFYVEIGVDEGYGKGAWYSDEKGVQVTESTSE